MNINGNNSIVGNIFDGDYSIQVHPVPIGVQYDFWLNQLGSASGITGAFVYFTPGSSNIDLGYLSSGRGITSGLDFPFSSIISGASEQSSSLSGYLFSNLNTAIYGACHGVGNTGDTIWYDGYNFYNAFHPEGTFSPPFGQNITIYKTNKDGQDALVEAGSCANLTIQEYNDLFGIVSTADDNASASADNITNGSQSFINSPAYACPGEVITVYYWHETQYNIIGGTVGAITANTFFNSNPIPTSLDNFNQKTALRYSFSGETGPALPDGTKTEIRHISYDGYGKPIPAYSINSGASILNTFTCPSVVAESSTLVGTQTHSQLLESAGNLKNSQKGFFDFFNWWNLYHFLFKENSDGFPFQNGYQLFQGDGITVQAGKSTNYGSQLFEAQLSDENNYWDRRQCPMSINFLPHTFGGAIYACPSYTFEIPYYAGLKKFGFYGTRFLNGCVSLGLDYELNGSQNASDLPSNYSYDFPTEEEPVPDKGILFSTDKYDNLLKVAAQEERHSDFLAFNKGLFLWANSGLVATTPEYQYLLTKNSRFKILYDDLFNPYNQLFPSGKNDLLYNDYLFESGTSSTMYDTGLYSDVLSTNANYLNFKERLYNVLSGGLQTSYWETIEKNYSYGILKSLNNVDSNFYSGLETGRKSRMFTRYLENYVKGNAIDLYPTNKIYFNFDSASGYIESTGWGKSDSSFGSHSFLDPKITKRYFMGAYINGQDRSGISDFNSNLQNISNSSFYPGYFDTSHPFELPVPSYVPVISGVYDDTNDPAFNINSIIGNQFQKITPGWNLIGYNGVGKLNANFSCFTPIFVKNPFPITHCKVGQAPTFRSLAVDYHTIPEDKMNNRYPEITYWMDRLKIGSNDKSIYSKNNNKYPLSYKWYRIKKSDCGKTAGDASAVAHLDPLNIGKIGSIEVTDFGHNYETAPNVTLVGGGGEGVILSVTVLDGGIANINVLDGGSGYTSVPDVVISRNDQYLYDFKGFLLNPDFSKVSASDVNGDWCCLEGDCQECTLIHPKLCEPVYSSINSAWNPKYKNTPAYQQAKQNNFYMTSMKGAIAYGSNSDDLYYYFCIAQGRFGVRISEPSQLFIEKWLQFDVSVRNGGNVSPGEGGAFTVKLETNDGSAIEFPPKKIQKYEGFVQDDDAIPEDIVEEQIPPPNRGYGDVYSYRFVGDWKYRGVTQTYTPGTLRDTRGLKEQWGRLVHYGSLVNYSKILSQEEGDRLYGRSHLPVCVNKQLPPKRDGIRVVVDGVVHWANMQNPVACTSPRYGVVWSKLGNAGELYTPSYDVENAGEVTSSPGLGQWQWGNNLGTIHNFGWDTPKSAVTQLPYALSDTDFAKLKKNLLEGGVLGGSCGYHKNGLGRNMSHWIEGFNAFYLYCDPLKKKNVSNLNYMGPGLRQTNSSIQYFWLGKPSNSYLDRYPMVGPYAYQWKVQSHNRDRNGNGVSEGFYSYGWNKNYSLLYDLPAIYGLFMKYGKKDSGKLQEINQMRTAAFGGDEIGALSVPFVRFGFTNGDGTARRYGNTWIGNINDPEPSAARDYVNKAAGIATTPQFGLYGCSDEDLNAGRCFDPCLSIRYQNGFVPGGKKHNMPSYKQVNHLVANSPVINNSYTNLSVNINGSYFRGPFGTPHLKYLAKTEKIKINGLSPCFDGGADHCNYITPNINIGASVYYEATGPSALKNAISASQAVNF